MGNYSIYVFTGLLNGHGRRRGRDRARARAGARDPRALAQAVQEGHVGAARDARRARRRVDDRQRHAAGRRGPRGDRRRHGAQERLRPRHGGPGRPRRPALRVRGGLRHHEGPAAVEPLRQEVRRRQQGGELLLQRPLAVGGARDQAREGDRLQLPRRAEAGRAGRTRTRPRCRRGPRHGRRFGAGRGSRERAGARGAEAAVPAAATAPACRQRPPPLPQAPAGPRGSTPRSSRA